MDRTSESSCGAAFDGSDVAPEVCKTLSDEALREVKGGAAPTLQQRMGTGGNQVPVSFIASIDADKCKPSNAEHQRKGGSGMGISEEDVAYTMLAQNGIEKQNAVAVRTAQTSANGCGIADEAAHTLDRAQGQGVAVGFSHVASGAMLDCVPGPVGVPLKRSPDGENAAILETTNQQEEQDANAEKTRPGEILRLLLEAIGEEAVERWVARIDAPLRTKEILRHEMRIEGGASAQGESSLDDGALPREEACSAGALRSMREAERDGCTPQGRELAEQCTRELGTDLQELSCQGPPSEAEVQDLWCSDEGARILQQALRTLQEIRESPCMEEKPAFRHIVRRLTPIEAERLQGFPDNWTRIPWRGKPEEECPDSPRYRSLGNSMACNCVEWVLRRIVAAMRLGIV